MSSNKYSIQSKNNIKFGKLQRKSIYILIGISEGKFKLRYANNKKSFIHKKYQKETELLYQMNSGKLKNLTENQK